MDILAPNDLYSSNYKSTSVGISYNNYQNEDAKYDTKNVSKNRESINQNLSATNASTDMFWKSTNHYVDVVEEVSKTKNYPQFIKSIPPAENKLSQCVTEIAYENSKMGEDRKLNTRNKADYELAMENRKLMSLRNETENKQFSYWCNTAEYIADNCNAHPSLKIYYIFLKRFMMVTLVLCILNMCSTIYLMSCKWYPDKDLKFGFERTFLGNGDGVDHLSQGQLVSNTSKENSEVTQNVAMSVDVVSIIFFCAFLIRQIYISKAQLNEKESKSSITNYAIKVSLQKGCPTGVEREIQKNFIKFGKIIEIIPIKNYGKVMNYEMDYINMEEKIKDRKAKDEIRDATNQSKLKRLMKRKQGMNIKRNDTYKEMNKDINTEEVIVVFEDSKNKNQCLKEYAKYSKWYSCKKLPNEDKLFGDYSFKVYEAPEPFDYALENWRFSRLFQIIKVLLFIILLTAGVMTAYQFMIKQLNTNYNNIQIYTECDKYNFNVVTTSSYTPPTTAKEEEINCFCRHLGYDKIQDNCSGTTNVGCKSVCQYWIDYHRDYYSQFFYVMMLMLAINVVVTYGFKTLFHHSIFKSRYHSTRYVMTATCVCLFTALYLGIMPELYFGSNSIDLDRVWYLKSGTLYFGYFIWMLFLYPIETLIYWLITLIHRKCVRSTKVIQKDLNKLLLGQELDYSHKIGRLMGHAFICIYHGISLPMIYVLFFVHVAMFLAIEKLMMLKFYRKMELQTAWIRQYLIHVLFIIVFLHCLRAIDVLGAEELFPLGFKQDVGIKNGTLVTYYKAKTRNYLSRLISYSGYPYIGAFICLLILYSISWWAHTKCLSLFFRFLALNRKTSNNLLPVSSLKQKSCFSYTTYDFDKMPKYKDIVSTIENSLKKDFSVESHERSNSMNIESQYPIRADQQIINQSISKSNNGDASSQIAGDNCNSSVNFNPDAKQRNSDIEQLDEISLKY